MRRASTMKRLAKGVEARGNIWIWISAVPSWMRDTEKCSWEE